MAHQPLLLDGCTLGTESASFRREHIIANMILVMLGEFRFQAGTGDRGKALKANRIECSILIFSVRAEWRSIEHGGSPKC